MCQNHNAEYIQNQSTMHENVLARINHIDFANERMWPSADSLSALVIKPKGFTETPWRTHARNTHKHTRTHSSNQAFAPCPGTRVCTSIQPRARQPNTRQQHLIKHVTHTQLAYKTHVLWASSKTPPDTFHTNTQTATKKRSYITQNQYVA